MSRLVRAWPLVLLLSGCGMYGDLYLEEEAPRTPEITEVAPIVLDEPAADESTGGADDGEASPEDEEREDDTAGAP